MRIFKLILKSVGIMALILVLAGLASREILLIVSLDRLKDSLKLVKEISKTQARSSECMSRGSVRGENGMVHQTQLRFLDSNEFVIEVVCNQFPLSPIKISDGSLPMLVQKEKGYSGVIWNSENPGLNIFVLGRVAAVYVNEEGFVRTQLKPSVKNFHPGPSSECSSYGYACCDANSQAGAGKQQTLVLDCPKTCFEKCEDRPLVLSFLTQPYYDKMTRLLEVSPGTEVKFNYTISPSQDDIFAVSSLSQDADFVEKSIYKISKFIEPKKHKEQQVQVVVNFGDGERQTVTDLQGQVSHVYTCNKSQCKYKAQLTAINKVGVKSVQDLDSTINILVK